MNDRDQPGGTPSPDPAVMAGRPSRARRAVLSPRSLLMGVAAVLLTLLPVGSCVVPEDIVQYQPSTLHAPPVITVALPAAVINCVDDHQLTPTKFSATVTDADGLKGTPLDLRWFVDYTSDDPVSSSIVLPGELTPTIQGNQAGYPTADITSDLLQLTRRGVGIHTVEVVITDAFDGNGAAPPRNRAPAAHSYIASYKWVINYLGPGNCGG